MLAKFSVKNFKCFKERLDFDFTNIRDYSFNEEVIKNNTVNKAIIYGINASGKSNLGFAIFDIIIHATDKEKIYSYYNHYFNAENDIKTAEFFYMFKFDKDIVEYEYKKEDYQVPFYEKLKINGKIVVECDRKINSEVTINLEEARTLKTNIENDKLSVIKYIKNNANYEKESVIGKFFDFLDRMLWFRSVKDNSYLGFTNGKSNLSDIILENNLVKDFENFLNEMGIKCKLSETESSNKKVLAFDFGREKIPYYEIVSNGTADLCLFYCWMQNFKNISFLFIDEFDAHYHQDLAEKIVERLKKFTETQTVLTTHCSGLMNNHLLRPDCYFELENGKILPLFKKTNKELREAHNLEKIYRAGGFKNG